jgi:hypothetical protein
MLKKSLKIFGNLFTKSLHYFLIQTFSNYIERTLAIRPIPNL